MRGRWLFRIETTILLAFRGAWRGRVSLSSLYPSLVSCHPVLDGKVTAQSPDRPLLIQLGNIVFAVTLILILEA